MWKLQVATVLTQDEVLATSAIQQQIRTHVFRGYNKNAHPNNSVSLTYTLTYDNCPIPDPVTGTLVSELIETQVIRSASSSSSSSSFYSLKKQYDMSIK